MLEQVINGFGYLCGSRSGNAASAALGAYISRDILDVGVEAFSLEMESGVLYLHDCFTLGTGFVFFHGFTFLLYVLGN